MAIGSLKIDNHHFIGICVSMAVDMELTPKTKRAAGERCYEPVVYPDVERESGGPDGGGREGAR